MHTLRDHIAALSKRAPDTPILLSCGETGEVVQTITRAQLLEKIDAVAARLRGLGLASGDRVALVFGNSPEFLILSWAAWSMGVGTVPFDIKRDTEELRRYKLQASGAKQVLTGIPPAAPAKVEWISGLSHEALVLFTSGTTAYPKGARLTLKNLIVNAEGIRDWLHIDEKDCFLVVLPLHHINSTTFCLATLLAGGSIAIPPQYSNSHFFEQAANTGATYTSVVPSIIFDQLKRKEEYHRFRARLRLDRIQIGSAPVVATSAREFIKAFGIPLYQGYGQTETALRVTGVPMDLPPALYEKMVEENSIGTPMPWAQVEIFTDRDRFADELEEGEIAVKGDAVMAGYLTKEDCFHDGYFLTGDIGFWRLINGQRFFFLKGRKKEIIIKGGINISPVAVENNLKKISNDIDQTYVVGVPDERHGEEVAATVVFKESAGAGALRRLKFLLLTGTPHLSAYETPRYVRVARAEELPTTSTGKVQRTALKEVHRERYDALCDLLVTGEYRFSVITPQSLRVADSRELHNHCWQPLTLNVEEYRAFLQRYLTLGAIDRNGTLQGQISFDYDDKKISCVSICSRTYRPKPVPEGVPPPSPEIVRDYVLGGHDGVYNFHKKLGAMLVEVTPGGRPEDARSCGYTMLLRYPPFAAEGVTEGALVSVQLIEAVRILTRDVGAEVYAVSRPGGLAAYLSR